MKGKFYVNMPKAPDKEGVLKAKIMYQRGRWSFSRTAEVHTVNVNDYGSVDEALADMRSKLPERAAVAQNGLQSMPNYKSTDDYGGLLEEAYCKGAGLPLPHEAINSRQAMISRLNDEDRLQYVLMDMENRNHSRSHIEDLCGSADFIGRDTETGQVRYAQRGWTDPYRTHIMPLPMLERRREEIRRRTA